MGKDYDEIGYYLILVLLLMILMIIFMPIACVLDIMRVPLPWQ